MVEQWAIGLALVLSVLSADAASFAIFQINGGNGFGGGSNLRAQNIFGASVSVPPSQYYTPGTGNPAVSTADWYHVNGLYWMRPYNLLDAACGSAGAAIAANKGQYAWVVSADHPDTHYDWSDGNDFYIGYSNDPAVLPQTVSPIIRWNNNVVSAPGSQTNFQLYQAPEPVCNPDDAINPFYLYAEGNASSIQHEEGLATSPDLSSWTVYGGTHLNPTFTQWSSFQRVVRDGVNSWHSTGLQAFFGANNYFANGKWTSTDGKSFSTGALFNVCLPVSSPNGSTGSQCNGGSEFDLGPSLDAFSVAAQTYTAGREDTGWLNSTNTTGQYVTRVPVDASFNILASPSDVRISNKYNGVYPGPGYLQSVGTYVENGVAIYLAQAGFFPSTSNDGLVNGATYANGGGLWQEQISIYCEVIDATAAANSAPMGVAASAAAGIVTLSWYNCLPHQTYRVYYGYSAASQPNLVGDVTGLSTTYTPYLQTPQTLYFKVVTLNSGVEEGSRVVSAYVSSSAQLVNSHIARALAAEVDPATIDRNFLDTAYATLVTQGLTNNLRTAVHASFGVAQDASGIVSKVFDLGTTRLPRGGDLTLCTGTNPCSASTATYNPTALGSTTPGWVNPSTNGFGYFGGSAGGRMNNLRRMVQITMCASYSKPGTALATLVGFGGPDFQPPQMALQHTAGTPGNASFTLWDDAQGKTVTAAMSSATGPHVICGTFDTTGASTPTSTGMLKVYADGVVTGSPDTSLHSNIDLSLNTTLRGAWGDNNQIPYLGTGSSQTKGTAQTAGPGPLVDYSRVISLNEGNFTGGSVWIFDVALNQTQITAITNLLLNQITPPVAIAYNITSAPYSATCNGTADDSAAFSAWNTAAVAWDAANPGVTGSIVLTIPNSKCMFLQMGSGISIVKGILNHPVRVVGAGASSELSDGGTGGGFFPGALGEFNDNAHHANTATVSKGTTTIPLSACPGAGCSAALALFTVGGPALMTGIDPQGPGGYPSNPMFWDFVTIDSKTTTSVVVTAPLTHDYKSTWPNYGAGSGGAIYPGGPATLYALDSSWPLTVEYNTLKLSQTNPSGCGFSVPGKSVTFKNVVITGNTTTCGGLVGRTCGVPSQNQTFAVINATMTNCQIEVDKIIDTMIYQNVSAVTNIDFQSASAKQAILSEVNATSFVNGGGINNIIANSTVASWGPGAHSFGVSYGQTYVLGNSIAAVVPEGASQSAINTAGTWSGGTFSYATSNGALNWAVPGANVYFAGGHPTQGPMLQVADLSVSGANTVVSFNQGGSPYAGGFPTMPLNAGAASINVHPAPQFTASGNTGSADIIDLNQTTPGAPMWSYSKRSITSVNGNPASPITLPVWGQMVGVNITVGTAYAGSTGTMHFDLNGPFFQTLGSSSIGQWNTFEINAKVASATARFLGPTSTSGAQSGDTLTSPSGGANTWFHNNQTEPVYSSIPGDFGSTSTTIEIITNQGVVNP